MASESGETEGPSIEEELTGTAPVEMPPEATEEEEEAEPEEVRIEATRAGPKTEGRRTQLRRVSDSLQILSNEVGRFRKSHEVNAKSLEAQVASLRKEFAAHIRSKEAGGHTKAREADSKHLEKQITLLRNELASLKTQMAKEAAKSRAKEEAALSRIIAKVKASRPAKPSKKKR